MAGPFAYYQYTVNSTGNIGSPNNGLLTSGGAPTAVLVPEIDGSLADANGTGGNNLAADTFTIGLTTYTLTGGFTTGLQAGDFTATAGGVTYYFSRTNSLPNTYDVNASGNGYKGTIGNATTGTVAELDALNIALTCFLAGTMIRTGTGETAIDKLAIGDLVITADGSLKPVKFIGRQTVAMLFADKAKAQPILIKAGALGQNLPTRDLYTSPGHAMLMNGALVIAGALVNGTSVVRWEDVPATFTYYHVELEGHEIVFAEGAATETYCDNVPRDVFDNAAEYKALYPNAKPITQLDLPTVKSARQLPVATARMLEQRAAALGLAASKAA